MKWHVGVLSRSPQSRPISRWLRARYLPDRIGMYPKFDHELAVWLAMPGFSHRWHAEVLGKDRKVLRQVRQMLPGFEEIWRDVGENWLSATRADVIKLAHLRPPIRRSPIPLLVQFRILDEVKAGRSQTETARTYNTCFQAVHEIVNRGVRWSGPLPEGFRLMVRNSQLNPDPTRS